MVINDFKKNFERIRELEIQTKRALRGSIIGNHQSRQKGFGFDFDQLRAYQYGDDVRLIDWKNSARGNGLLVRQYFEERNRTFIICVDVSASTYFGSKDVLKIDILKQVAGVLALAGQYSGDKVGMILFADGVEKEILPAKGDKHIHYMIETLFEYKPKAKQTDLNKLFEHIAYKTPKNAVVFILSDFIVQDIVESSLKKAAISKELFAIACVDDQEKDLASVGLLWAQDLESGEKILLDARRSNQRQMQELLKGRIQEAAQLYRKHRIDMLEISSNRDFIHDLIMFFQKRLLY